MARLYLKFEQTLLKEVALPQETFTIGRLPDNSLQIDHLAVSGHHCRIQFAQGHYVVEDANSLNGTYVNGQRVSTAILKDDDQVLVGKHILLFNQVAEEEAVEVADTESNATGKVALSGSEASKAATDAASSVASTAVPTPALDRVGVLTVLEGKTDEKYYVLKSRLSVIGKDEMASIKLKGWFAPKVAANVMRRETKYIIAAADKDVKLQINGEPAAGQHELSEGDTIELAGFKFRFAFQE